MGTLRLLRTEQDHDEALREIERLWGADPDTPEGDRLDVLVTLVEVYERALIGRPGVCGDEQTPAPDRADDPSPA